MATVLVTGGTGFVGYWMKQTQPGGITSHYINKDEYKSWNWHYERFTHIVHLAPIAPRHIIEHIQRYGGRLLYASSGAIYSRNTEYAELKRVYEEDCLDSGIDVVIARLFTFYGEHLDEDKAISRFIKAAKAGEPIRIWGDGFTVRSYMYGRTMGEWLWAILLKGKSGEAYDVGSDVPVTMLELANMVCQNVNNVPIIMEDRYDDCPVYLPRDTEKTRRLLRE